MGKIIELGKLLPSNEEEDIPIEINRTEEFFRIAQELSDFIHTLPLSVEQNDKLVKLMIDQVQEAERGAFGQGLCMGTEYERWEQEKQ